MQRDRSVRAEWLNRSLLVGPYLTLCTTEEMFRRALVKDLGFTKHVDFLSTPQSHATTHFLNDRSGKFAAVVCLGSTEGRKPIEVAGLLVHEAVHVWQEHCKHIGEQNPGDETEAYAIQWISQQLFWEFVRQTSVQGEPVAQ